jgi:hypothetical protein
MQYGGASDATQHAINEDELVGFVEHINMELKSDKDVGHLLPIDCEDMSLFERTRDGLVLRYDDL